MKTLLAIILLLSLLAPAFLFENRWRGFSYTVALVVLILLTASLLLQAVGFYTYPLVLTSSLLLSGTTAVYTWKNRRQLSFRADIWLLVLIVTTTVCLWQIHYSYTGDISTTTTIRTVQNASYPLPIYSDEWIAAAMVRSVIAEQTLPLINPLLPDTFYPNLLVSFHSLLSGFFLLTGLSHIKHFAVAGIATSLFVITALYALLRSLKIQPATAALTATAALLITQGGNLPGLWFLLPFLPALGFYLLHLAALQWQDRRLALLTALCSCLLYPPFFLFVLISLIGEAFEKLPWKQASLRAAVLTLSVIFIIFLTILITDLTELQAIEQAILNGLSHPNQSGNTPDFFLWYILPLPVLLLAAVGLWLTLRARQYVLLLPVVLGLAGWHLYLIDSHVYLIEAPRVVIITSTLLLVPAGLSLQKIADIWTTKHQQKQKAWQLITAAAIVALLILLAVFYPLQNKWQLLQMRTEVNGEQYIFQPSPPLNYHLLPDDARIFSAYARKRFIAPEWKGLVIGAISDNYPLHSKGSTITNRILLYEDFVAADCTGKTTLANEHQLDLVYSEPFSCPDFAETDRSSQGLTLYRYTTQE